MSRRKKKVRNPSPEAAAQLQKERDEREARLKAEREAQLNAQAEGRVAREEEARAKADADAAAAKEQAAWRALPESEKQAHFDELWLKSLSPEERKYWCDAGECLYGRLMCLAPIADGPLTADEVRGSLDVCTRFLTRLVDTTHGVLEALDPNTVRKIVAADVPLSDHARQMLKAAGHHFYEDVAKPAAEDATEASPQKRPRGARHPLMALFSIAVQASRLLQQITRGLWPHVHNQRTLSEKEAERQARQSTKMNAMEGLALVTQASAGAT